MAGLAKEDMVCEHCHHKLTDHWSGGCGCKRNGELIIECECPGYFPKGEKYTERAYSKYSVEEAKLTILRKLGY